MTDQERKLAREQQGLSAEVRAFLSGNIDPTEWRNRFYPDKDAKQWPRCTCGGVAVSNASGDITRTCIRCGKIVKAPS